MITITIKEMIEVITPLNALIKRDLPVKTSYHIAKLARKMNSELDTFNAQVDSLRVKHNIKDAAPEDMDSEEFKEREAEYHKEFDELMEVTIDVDMRPFKLSEFGNVDLPPQDLYGFLPFIEDEDD
jgi:hypothetical protein